MSDHTELVERPNLHNADEIAAFLSEWLTIGDGSLRGVPFVAVQIAEAAEASLQQMRKALEEAREGARFAAEIGLKQSEELRQYREIYGPLDAPPFAALSTITEDKSR